MSQIPIRIRGTAQLIYEFKRNQEMAGVQLGDGCYVAVAS